MPGNSLVETYGLLPILASAMTSPSPPATGLDQLTIRDAQRLRRRLDGTRKIRDQVRRTAATEAIEADIAVAAGRAAARAASVPALRLPG